MKSKMFLMSSILISIFLLSGCPALEPLGFPPTTDRRSDAYHDWQERQSLRREHAIKEAELKVEHEIERDKEKEGGWEIYKQKNFPEVGEIIVEYKRGITLYVIGASDPSWAIPEGAVGIGTWYFRVTNESPIYSYIKIIFELDGYVPYLKRNWVKMSPWETRDWGHIKQWGNIKWAPEAHGKITKILVKTESEYLNDLKKDEENVDIIEQSGIEQKKEKSDYMEKKEDFDTYDPLS